MFDLFFDGMMAVNAFGFLFGGIVMAGIGLLLTGFWVSWRVRSYRVKGRVAAIKVSGERRSEEDWRAQYEKEAAEQAAGAAAQPGFFEGLAKDFREAPFKSIPAYLFVGVIAMVPISFFIFGVYSAYDYIGLRYGGVKTEAHIVDVVTEYDSESGTTYHPIVSFRDGQGRHLRERDKVGTGWQGKFKKGAETHVYYDPDDPAHFILDSFWRYMGIALIFAGLGGGIIGVVIFSPWVMRRGGAQKISPAKARRRINAMKQQAYVNQQYMPVYEFNTEDGEIVRAEGHDDASNWLADKLPGRAVTLMVVPGKDGKPPKVKRPGKMLLVFGLLCLLPGLFLIRLALGQMAFNAGTALVLCGGLGLAGYKMRGFFKGLRDNWHEIKAVRGELKNISVETKSFDGYELTQPEIRERLRFLDRNALIAVPFLLAFGLGMMFGGYHLFKDMHHLSGVAMIARGEIVDMNSRSNSDGGYTYYPVVSYETLEGDRVKFEGKTGSNPPMFRTGDKVTVLYDPGRPEKAIIDNGWLNWLPSLGLAVAGILLTFYCLSMFTGIMRRRARR